MKITDITIRQLQGIREADGAPYEARSAKPVDIYDEFRDDGPERSPGIQKAGTKVKHLFVEVHTDSDVSGVYGPILMSQVWPIEHQLGPFLVGRDPLPTERLWNLMVKAFRHSHAGYMLMAISALDCALWDLRGKHEGQPVYRLIGDAQRGRVPAYGSMLGHSLQPDMVHERASAFFARGFTSQKWFFRHGPGSGEEGKDRNEQLAATLREALGNEAELMFDAYMSWNVEYAVEMANRLAPYKPKWLEEALPPYDLDGWKQLKAGTDVPLAAGEHLYGCWDVKPFLDAGILDYVQTDPDWCGGITELVRICKLAGKYGAKVVPHGHDLLSALHVAASQPEETCPMVEHLFQHLANQHFFLQDVPAPEDGWITVPDRPGLGIVFNKK
ncbi:enolase C-terminal domain-like protein [Verrucomicrobiota bacterium]